VVSTPNLIVSRPKSIFFFTLATNTALDLRESIAIIQRMPTIDGQEMKVIMIRVPIEVWRQVRIKAAETDQSMQSFAAKAIIADLSKTA
jgi:hypothetical protein